MCKCACVCVTNRNYSTQGLRDRHSKQKKMDRSKARCRNERHLQDPMAWAGDARYPMAIVATTAKICFILICIWCVRVVWWKDDTGLDGKLLSSTSGRARVKEG